MVHVEGSVVVDRPANLVFDFVLDGTHNILWRPNVTDVRLRRGRALGEGAEFRQGISGPGGARVDGDYKIVECEAEKLIRIEVTSGAVRPEGVYHFEAQGQSTRVTLSLHFTPSGLNRMLEPMVRKALQEEIATLPNLKTYLEAHS